MIYDDNDGRHGDCDAADADAAGGGDDDDAESGANLEAK